MEEKNILNFAKEIENAVETYNHNSFTIKSKGKLASCYIRENYNILTEEKDVMNIWQRLL